MIALWFLALVATTVGHRALGGSYSDDFTLPDSPVQHGSDLLRAHQPSAGGFGGQLVFTGALTSDRDQIESAVHAVAGLPHVLSVSDPLNTVSADGRIAYANVHFDENPVTLGQSYVTTVNHATAGARAAGVAVDYGGALGQAARPAGADRTSEIIGVSVAIIVLLLGFGSVLGAGLPIVTAVLGVVTGLGLLGMAAAAVTFASVSPTLATMMGLGVGIDYALFLTTRHRQHLRDGMCPVDAAATTLATSGRAVFIAASTVVIALCGLYASGIGFIGRLGLAAGITVVVAAIAAITLVPALLGLAGRHIDRLRVRRPVAEPSTGEDGTWQRHAARIGRHPWLYLVAGALVTLVLAIPVLSLRLGHIDAGADPSDYTDRRAYDAIGAGFGPGANGPFTVVVTPGTASLAGPVHQALADTPGVASVGTVAPTSDGALLVATVIPDYPPQDSRTDRLMTTLRDTSLPSVLPAGTQAYVTGTTAGQLYFRDQVASHLPVIIAVVIASALVLLLASFRSVAVAVKAAVLNLLSIGAAYGVVVAVFQWGWGGSLLGVSEPVPVESYVPMMMFAIVFGLSMDYEVFLLSRIREAWLSTRDNTASVAAGLAATARVITCAALIMTSVFPAFLLSTNVVIKTLALGLGVSVIVDATVIRLLVVPAAMFLLGKANWWIPRWLDRVLPRLEAEPSAVGPLPERVVTG
ncbi:MAG TPA: MMPL family transporter [Pseudonocardiaceae bacterium]|nr:MMPL family transporter [Pseudonocardiaceae bacterium]